MEDVRNKKFWKELTRLEENQSPKSSAETEYYLQVASKQNATQEQ